MFNRLKNFCINHRNLTAFALGSLAVQALPPFYRWYLLFVCLSGLLCLINSAPNKKQAFAVGYWFGFGFFAFGLSWVNQALLIAPAQTGWLIPITFLASGGFFGLFIAIPAWLSWYFRPLIARYLALAAWVVIFEWIRSWFLTGFPWNLWGSCLAFNPVFIQSASIWGTYGLSLLIWLTATAPAFALVHHTKKAKLISLTVIILLPLLLWGYGTWRLNKYSDKTEGNTKLRLVQPSIPQSIKWSPDLKSKHLQTYIDLSRSQPLDDIDMVIWGETASPYALDRDEPAKTDTLKAINNNGYLITGQIRYEDNYYNGWNAYNSSLIISSSGIIEDFYDKSHLVPFGEYVPMREYLPQAVQPIANIIGTMNAGQGPKIINLDHIPPFGIQICYEIIFPHRIINPQHKPEWVLNLTNDGWYGLSSGPYQHLVTTQLRAVEEGITIVRSANSGISAIINRTGEILASLALNKSDILDISLPQQTSTPTPYNKLGNTFILSLCLLCLLISAGLSRKH